MLALFRLVALAEGLTTIALFCIAMPLKYWGGDASLVPPAGMTHGVAWLAYLAAMALCLPGRGFSPAEWARVFVAALIPFGTLCNDGMTRRKEAIAAPA